MSVPLFIVCAYAPCGKVREVTSRRQQRRQKFCSHRCGWLGRRHPQTLTTAGMAKGGRTRALRARLALLARLDGVTPVDAFKLGYHRGLQAKWRQLRRRYVVTKREA